MQPVGAAARLLPTMIYVVWGLTRMLLLGPVSAPTRAFAAATAGHGLQALWEGADACPVLLLAREGLINLVCFLLSPQLSLLRREQDASGLGGIDGGRAGRSLASRAMRCEGGSNTSERATGPPPSGEKHPCLKPQSPNPPHHNSAR